LREPGSTQAKERLRLGSFPDAESFALTLRLRELEAWLA
jgi:hypothetical protein